MKKLIKLIFILIIGIMFTACGGPKIGYDLEGKYESKQERFYRDGTLGEKEFTTIDISKKGSEYTIKGDYLLQKREVIHLDYVKRIDTYGDWIEISKDSYTFKGKLVKVLKAKPKAYEIIQPKEKIFLTFENKNGQQLDVYISKDIFVENLLTAPGVDYTDIVDLKNYNKVDEIMTSSRTINVKTMIAYRMKK